MGPPIPRTSIMALAMSWAPVEWRLAQRMLPAAVSNAAVTARTMIAARIRGRIRATFRRNRDERGVGTGPVEFKAVGAAALLVGQRPISVPLDQ